MNKKIMTLLISAVFTLSLSACTQNQPAGTGSTRSESTVPATAATTAVATAADVTAAGALQTEKNTGEGERFDYLGVSIPKSPLWQEYGQNVRSSGILTDYQDEAASRYGWIVNDFLADEILEVVRGQKTAGPLRQDVADGTRSLFQILIYGKGRNPELDKVKQDSQCKYVNKISEENGLAYFFCWNDLEEKGLSEKSAAKYKQLYEEMLGFKQNLTIYPPEEKAVAAKWEELAQMQKDAENSLRQMDEQEAASKEELSKKKKLRFETTDLNGNAVSSEVFKDNKITMINIWATFCGPCIEEMPDLQALSEEMEKQGVRILGLVGDTAGADGQVDKANLDLAKEIVKSKKVQYTNLVINKELAGALPVSFYPTTLFVDKEGNVVGEVVIGSKGKDEYKKLIQQALKNAGK